MRVGNEDRTAVVAVVEKPAVVATEKVDAVERFLVSDQGERMTKRVWSFLVPRANWLHPTSETMETKTLSRIVDLMVYAMCRVGWRQSALLLPVIWIAASNHLNPRSLWPRIGPRLLELQGLPFFKAVP